MQTSQHHQSVFTATPSIFLRTDCIFVKVLALLMCFFSRFLSAFGVSSPDQCRCACSGTGCTPTSILFRNSASNWYNKLDYLKEWCNALRLCASEVEACCVEFAGPETFERLGLTHACCRIEEAATGKPQMLEEDQLEIMEEESLFIDELEQ